jgi:DNA topoisomerase-2
MSKINKIKMKNTLEDENANAGNEEDDEESSSAGIPAREYDYLLSMPLWSLTYEKVEELLKNKDNKVHEIEVLTGTTEHMLWENDIEHFLKVLDVSTKV